jgi:hypothetical protein
MMLRTATIASLVSLVALACAPSALAPPPRTDTGGTGCANAIASSANGLCVTRIAGRVTDVDGAPIAGATVTLCGAGQCIDMPPSPTGDFELALSSTIDPSVFALHAEVLGQPFGIVYAPLPQVRSGLAVLDQPLRLPRITTAGDRITRGRSTGQTVTAGDVTLTIPAGAMIVPSFADEMSALEFRAIGVARYQAPPFVTHAALDAVWSLAPGALTSSMPMRVRLRNRPGYPRATTVELVVMGHDLEADRFDAGHAVTLGSARVSDDGAFIESDAGVGLRELYWIGVRRR